MSFVVTSDKDQQTLINNRQNGRRRGRGGPQVRGGGGGNGADRGNRIDNRARGNAVQLHEKYKNLARDAQTQGDRVMTEYYLQFADHYFRVLSENRARFDDQQPRRARDEGRDDGDFFDTDQDEGEEGLEGERYDRRPPQRAERPQGDRQQNDRQPGDRQQNDRQSFDRQAERGQTDRQQPERQPERVREPQPAEVEEPQGVAAGEGDGEARRPRRGRRPRRPDGDEAVPRIDGDRLPPALSPEPAPPPVAAAPEPVAEPTIADLGEEAPKRRRTRRVAKDDGDSSVAA